MYSASQAKSWADAAVLRVPAGPRASLMQRMMADIVKAAAAGKASKHWLHSKQHALGLEPSPLPELAETPAVLGNPTQCSWAIISSALVHLAWLGMPHRRGLSACSCCPAVRPSMLHRFAALMSAPSGETQPPTDARSKKAKLACQRSSKEPMMQHNPYAYDPGAEPDGRRVACTSARGSCIPGRANGRPHLRTSKRVQHQAASVRQPGTCTQGSSIWDTGLAPLQGMHGINMHCTLEDVQCNEGSIGGPWVT